MATGDERSINADDVHGTGLQPAQRLITMLIDKLKDFNTFLGELIDNFENTPVHTVIDEGFDGNIVDDKTKKIIENRASPPRHRDDYYVRGLVKTEEEEAAETEQEAEDSGPEGPANENLKKTITKSSRRRY